MWADHWREHYGLSCRTCERFPAKRDKLGCCSQKAAIEFPPSLKGQVRPYAGAGLELTECPLSYGFYQDRDFTPSLSALLLEEYADFKVGVVPGWGQGSALYHRAMRIIRSYVSEREAELLDKHKAK